MPIEGNLKELSLPNIIQLNCSEMNTAAVSLRHQGKQGMLCFAEGAVIHAEVDDLVGEEAVYELLSWPDGSFVVQPDVLPPDRTVTANWSMLLLEGMRRIDEGQPDFEETTEGGSMMEMSGTDDMTMLAQSLKRVIGVQGAVIISRDGMVLANDMDGEAEKEGAVAVFVGNAADQIGQILNLNPFDWGVVTMGNKDRVLLLERPVFFIGLLMAEKASPALVAAEAAKILG